MATETGENTYNRYGQPALDFIFTGTKKSLKDRSGNRQLQVTRDSVGTYVDENGVIQTAASGEARFDHDPETGESLGLLVEEARTNLVTYSEDFSGTGWTGATIVSTNVTSSPDGTSTADLVYPSSTGFYRARYIPITTSGTVTLSAYVKSAGWRYINLSMVATVAAVKFDLIDNAYNVVNSNYSNADIHSVGNGWFRIQAACDVATVSGDAFAITFSDDFAGGMYATTSGTSGIYIWGAQLEVGSFPTSYIPTSGSTVIRAADVASLTNSSIYDTDSFTILNEPFGSAAGASTLSLVGAGDTPIKRTAVYSQELTQTQINASVGKTDEFWRWRILGDSFGLPNFLTDGQVTVDWGDGTVETLTTSDHTFTDGGGYHDIGFRLDSGTYFRPNVANNATHKTKVVAVGPAPASMIINGQNAFYGCSNLNAADPTAVLTGSANLSWYKCSSLTTFPLIDTSSVTSLYFAWRDCTSLTSFPAIDTSNVTDFTNTWHNCTSLTSFPLIDVSSGGNNFNYTWLDCRSLTSFPLINFSACTSLVYTWANCNSLTSFPLINTSSVTNFGAAWNGCSSLTSFPLIDTSSGTNFNASWYNCNSLTSFPLIDTSSGTNFQDAWYSCSSLTSFPAIDLSGATNLQQTWRGCSSMTTFSPTDMSNCSLFGVNTNNSNFAVGAWMFCTSLTSFPAADMSSATSIGWAWYGCSSMTSFGSITLPTGTPTYGAAAAWYFCSSLTSFPAIDLSGATDLQLAWRNCSSMTTFSPTDMSNCSLFGTNTTNGNFGYGAWRECTSLTSFPAADMSSATDIGWAWDSCSSMTSFGSITLPTGSPTYGATAAWYGCSSLTSFPAIDLSGATNLQLAWRNCSSMTTFSPTDMSNCTLFGLNTMDGNYGYGAWRSCTSLTSFPAADMSSATDIGWAWDSCSSMTSFGSITLPTGSPTYGATAAWRSCSSLTSFPGIDLSGATDLRLAWNGCSSMTTFSPTDMSNCTLFGANTTNGNYAYGAWRSCTSLTSFPAADMSSGIDYGWAWNNCSSMTSFGSCIFNTTSTSTFIYAWYNCSSLTTFPPNMFDNVIATVFNGAFTGCALTVQSVENILVSLDTGGQLNGFLDVNGGTTAGQASWTTAATTAYNNLVTKGWTISANP